MARKRQTVRCFCCSATVQRKEVALWRARLAVALGVAIFAIVCIVLWKDATQLLYQSGDSAIAFAKTGVTTHAISTHVSKADIVTLAKQGTGEVLQAATTATLSTLVPTTETLTNIDAHSKRPTESQPALSSFRELTSRDVCYGGYSPLPGKVPNDNEGGTRAAVSCESQNVCTIEECSARCDADPDCRSYTACAAECHRSPTLNLGSCFLKDRELSTSEEIGVAACGCTSMRKGCEVNDTVPVFERRIPAVASNDIQCLQIKSLQTANRVHVQEDSAATQIIDAAFEAFLQQPPRCNVKLLSISSENMQRILRRQTSSELRKQILAKLPFPTLRAKKQSYFIAAVLHHEPRSEATFLHWAVEVITSLFVLAAGEDMSNLFISLYHTGGDDLTPHYLELLSRVLTSLGVQHKLAWRGSSKSEQHETHADMRNFAMSDLFSKAKRHFDRVVWLEDALFCGHGLLEQVLLAENPKLGGVGADAVCGMDMAIQDGQCVFSERWPVHDVNGKMFQLKSFGQKWAASRYSQDAINQGVPFQVFSCWSGVVVFRGDIFIKEGLLFRAGRDIKASALDQQSVECLAPETHLIYRDMWHLGYHRVVITPNSRAAYDDAAFQQCVQGAQLDIHVSIPVWYRHFSPARIDCCGPPGANLQVGGGFSCRSEAWTDAYAAVGVPRQCAFKHLKPTKKAALPSTCARPEHWCEQAGVRFVDEQDCDGDGIPDPQCIGVGTQDQGFMASAFSCRDTWPHGICKVSSDTSFEATGRLPLPGHEMETSLKTPCIKMEDPISRTPPDDHTSDRKAAREKMLHAVSRTDCNDTLLGISSQYMREVIQGTASLSLRRQIMTSLPKPSSHPGLRSRSYYIVALLRNSQDIFPHWAAEIIKLLFALAADEHMKNLYVSVYESASSDLTPSYLEVFKDVLAALGVQHTLTMRGSIERKPGENRIAFLSRLRNSAMKAFFSKNGEGFDRVVWVSDNMFCGHGLLEQILLLEDEEHGGVGAHASCGMDFGVLGPFCAYYDRWATHDLNGVMFDNLQKWAPMKEHWAAIQRGAPVQVFTCWGGSVVYRGEIFHKEGLLFRRSRKGDEVPPLLRKSFTKECVAAETQLIMHDMWYLGYHKTVITPNSRSAYSKADFDKCVKDQQQAIQIGVPVHYKSDPPRLIECCSLPENSRLGIDFGSCPLQDWKSVYAVQGLPRQCDFEHIDRKLSYPDVGGVQ